MYRLRARPYGAAGLRKSGNGHAAAPRSGVNATASCHFPAAPAATARALATAARAEHRILLQPTPPGSPDRSRIAVAGEPDRYSSIPIHRIREEFRMDMRFQA